MSRCVCKTTRCPNFVGSRLLVRLKRNGTTSWQILNLLCQSEHKTATIRIRGCGGINCVFGRGVADRSLHWERIRAQESLTSRLFRVDTDAHSINACRRLLVCIHNSVETTPLGVGDRTCLTRFNFAGLCPRNLHLPTNNTRHSQARQRQRHCGHTCNGGALTGEAAT